MLSICRVNPSRRFMLVLKRTSLLMAMLIWCSSFLQSSVQAAASKTLGQIRQAHQQLQQQVAAKLEELATEMDALQQAEMAMATRALAVPQEMSLNRVVSLPRTFMPQLEKSSSQAEQQLHIRRRALRISHSKKLYSLARRAVGIGYPSYGYALLHEVLRFNPDHQFSRKIMGYQRAGNEWLTPFEAKMKRNQFIEHERFGWIPKSYETRYEGGERHYLNTWMSAAREREYRRDIKKGWTIESEHFVIKTNHSLERGVEISRKLEEFYRFFHQTFQSFFTTPQQMVQLFKNSSRRLSNNLRSRHLVFYFSNKEEYVNYLRRKIPGQTVLEDGRRVPKISITNGLYNTADRTAYFFDDAETEDDSAIYHEATHQLFYESAPRKTQVAERSNFWLMEGIACYMESYKKEGETLSVGNILHDRFYAARVRYLEDKHFIPTKKFFSMGMEEYQTAPRIAWNYSQASGLTHFFMHYQNGKYRPALIEHLVQIYAAAGTRPRPIADLSQLTQTSFADLDRQYGEYLRELDAQEKVLLQELQQQQAKAVEQSE